MLTAPFAHLKPASARAASRPEAHQRPAPLLHLDGVMFLVLLAAANLHLLPGLRTEPLVYFPQAVGAGAWWRLFTHPWVHLSWYHLLLDAGAFWLIYKELQIQSPLLKLLHIMICMLFSLGFAAWFSPLLKSFGLCGLSGVAHGLMAVSGLEMIALSQHRRLGWLTLGIVVTKSLWELATGKVVFAFLHLGLCGLPVAACHAGGVAGGILSYFLVNLLLKHSRSDVIRGVRPV